jgi:hypothetical protein
MKVGNKIWQSILAITVSQAVKGKSITITLFPTNTANSIKRFRELTHRFPQSTCLFYRWFEKYPNRSIHTDIIPYI